MFTAEPPRRHRGALSLRERQVVNLAALGLSDRQISEQMSVTLGTMAAYWARVRSKLDVRNRLQATTLLNHQRTGRIVTDLVKCLPHAQEAARTSATRSWSTSFVRQSARFGSRRLFGSRTRSEPCGLSTTPWLKAKTETKPI